MVFGLISNIFSTVISEIAEDLKILKDVLEYHIASASEMRIIMKHKNFLR
jgi:hypothetical protein